MKKSRSDLGLVLSAGGARAAYQVGVLSHLGAHCPDFKPTIFTGISAGSINAAFLAQGESPQKSTADAYRLWEQLTFDQVFKTNFNSMARMLLRWIYDMSVSKVTRRLLLKSLLDASPLAATLLTHIHFWKIRRAVRQGLVRGVAVTATNYLDGSTTTFFDSEKPIPPWARERRNSARHSLRIRHIMASCSIPILFEPVPIGKAIFGDGSLRFSFPFSPAIHLGASHLIAIGIRCPNPIPVIQEHRPDHLSLGFVAGTVLNSIFLDSLEFDYENICRINEFVGPESPAYVPVCLVRPSVDLGVLAKDFLSEVPFHFRQLLKTTAEPEELGDLLSYLMFSPGYVKALLELGRKDAERQDAELRKFLAPVA